jgi:hypothetical protein
MSTYIKMGVKKIGFEGVNWTELALDCDLWRNMLLSVLHLRPIERKSVRKLYKYTDLSNKKFWEQLIACFLI